MLKACRYIDGRYEVPQVIRSVGYDHSDVVIKASNGLDVKELNREGFLGQDVGHVMMRLAMESLRG